MAAIILAEASVTLLFGIDSGIAALTGYIANAADIDYTSKTAEASDDQGSTVAVAFFDQMIDQKFTALLLSGTTLPTPGSTVTIGTSPSAVLYAVMKVTKKEKNNGFTDVTIDLKRWSDNAIPN